MLQSCREINFNYIIGMDLLLFLVIFLNSPKSFADETVSFSISDI